MKVKAYTLFLTMVFTITKGCANKQKSPTKTAMVYDYLQQQNV